MSVTQVPPIKGQRLARLLDVSREPAQANQALVYNADEGQWEPGSVSGDVITDAAITDAKIGERTASGFTGLLTEWFTHLKTELTTLMSSLQSHKTQHAIGGTDVLLPADIGAATDTHIHANATTSVAGFLSNTDKSKLDGIQTGAAAVASTTPTAETVGATASTGTSAAAARADHRHAMPGTVTTSAAGFMSASDKTRLDSLPELATTNPAQLLPDTTVYIGNATTAAKADHRHAMPSLASSGAAGFMSAADKVKLDSISGTPFTPVITQVSQSSLGGPGTTYNDLPGMSSIAIPAGTCLIIGTTEAQLDGFDSVNVRLVVTGGAYAGEMNFTGEDNGWATMTRVWYRTGTATTAQLQARRSGTTGSTFVRNSTVTVIQLAP